MTELRRPCQRADGLTKFGYLTRKTARAAVRRTMKISTRPGRVHVYRCPDCDLFHVGHLSDA